MPIVVTIRSDQFILRDAESIDRVRADIQEAVRSGGRLVVMGDLAEGPEVLVTPATPVRIDIFTEPQAASIEESDFIDFDSY